VLPDRSGLLGSCDSGAEAAEHRHRERRAGTLRYARLLDRVAGGALASASTVVHAATTTVKKKTPGSRPRAIRLHEPTSGAVASSSHRISREIVGVD